MKCNEKGANDVFDTSEFISQFNHFFCNEKNNEIWSLLEVILTKIREELAEIHYPDFINSCYGSKTTVIEKHPSIQCFDFKYTESTKDEDISELEILSEFFEIGDKCKCDKCKKQQGEKITTFTECGDVVIIKVNSKILLKDQIIIPTTKSGKDSLYELTGIITNNESNKSFFRNYEKKWLCCDSGDNKFVNEENRECEDSSILFYQRMWHFSHTQISSGRGDSSLILLKKGGIIVKSVLVDTGIYKSASKVILAIEGINYLDAIVITHWHNDHYSGFEAIAKKFKNLENTHIFFPERFEIDGKKKTTTLIEEANAKVKTINEFIDHNFKNENIHKIKDNIIKSTEETINLFKNILFNGSSLMETEYGIVPDKFDIQFLSFDGFCLSGNNTPDSVNYNLNHTSIGLLVKGDGTNLLTCGDLGPKSSKIINKYLKTKDVPLHIVKLNHHGSKDNNLNNDNNQGSQIIFEGFKVALLSIGDNMYAHPNVETLNALSKTKKPFLCTNPPNVLNYPIFEIQLLVETFEYINGNKKQLSEFDFLCNCYNTNGSFSPNNFENNFHEGLNFLWDCIKFLDGKKSSGNLSEIVKHVLDETQAKINTEISNFNAWLEEFMSNSSIHNKAVEYREEIVNNAKNIQNVRLMSKNMWFADECDIETILLPNGKYRIKIDRAGHFAFEDGVFKKEESIMKIF
ncbi:hypothetical protein QTN25_005614 [Entamoeba marina]